MFYSYLDFTNDGEVFYVGKGNHSRCLSQNRNWLHQIISEEEGFNRAIVFESENEQECFDKEIELIEEYHTFFLDPLRSDNACNFTLGGEGPSGYKHTIETIEYLSQINARNAKLLLTENRHPLQGKRGSQLQQKRIENGTHHLLSGDVQRKMWENISQEEFEKRQKRAAQNCRNYFASLSDEEYDEVCKTLSERSKRLWNELPAEIKAKRNALRGKYTSKRQTGRKKPFKCNVCDMKNNHYSKSCQGIGIYVTVGRPQQLENQTNGLLDERGHLNRRRGAV